ncbi:MAG: hypothetical protein RQ741_00980 [Wenzhouxiangellaceae bacterium]|nr:hypothetical protein [Wenzhouxiangellaceae bacterium]
MKRILWFPTNALLQGIEYFYHKFKGLKPVGPLLYVQQTRYGGATHEFEDGLQLRPGDRVGVLHVNNRGLARAQRSGRSSSFIFARLMIEALGRLAEAVDEDPEMGRIAGFHGITWIPPHGRRVGFEAEPMPDSWRCRWLSLYFRILLFAFNPSASRRTPGRLQPCQFWLSRKQLLENFRPRHGQG